MSDNSMASQPIARPEHRLHDSSQPLPGARGAAPAADYSTATMERTPSSALDTDGIDNMATSNNFARAGGASGDNAFNSERPTDMQPAPEGGIVAGDNEDVSMGKANFGDKLIGKTQKMVGKIANKPLIQEKGELRETGGKAAVMDEARN